MPGLETCQCCGEEKILNDRSLCPNCRTAQVCAMHPDLMTMQRCGFCRKPACAYCVEDRLCTTCRDEGRVAPERQERAAKKVDSDEDRVARSRLMKLGAVFAVVVGGNCWYFFGGSLSSDEVCRQRLEAAQSITMTYMIHHRNLPKSLREIYATAKAEKQQLPLLIPAGCRPIPAAVSYSFDGKRYFFQTFTDAGKPFTTDGKIVEVSAP